MGYKLTSLFVVLLRIIKDTNEITVNISPNPAIVIAGNDLIISSTIKKTESESWKFFLFYLSSKSGYATCRGARYSPSSECVSWVDCSLESTFNCNYTNFILLIKDVTTMMSGLQIYAEVSGDASLKYKSPVSTIEVKIPLKGVFLTPNGTITKTDSEIQVLECFATSIPIASLSWQLDGSLLPTSSPPVITTDTITSAYTYTAQKDDNGKRLSCTAVYDSTRFSADALISVLYRPIVIVFPFNDPYLVIENTTDFRLTCIVTDAKPPVTSFTWEKDNVHLSNGMNYTVPTVHRSNAGKITCQAINSVGSSAPSAVIRLKVLYGVEIVAIGNTVQSEGTRLNITCTGQSYPAIRDLDVTWTKRNNNTFKRTGKQCVIRNVNREDSGTYVCYVVIELVPTVGQPRNVTQITTVDVNVLYRPTVSISPKYAEYNVIENATNLVITCVVVNANPLDTSFRWYKDGSIIDGYTDATYTISTVLRSNRGSYACDASNTIGTSDLSSLQLGVLYGDINSISKQAPTELTQLFVSCTITSNQESTNYSVTWTKQKNATFIRKGKQLVIDNVSRTDRGTYACSVIIELTPTLGQSVYVTGTTTVEVDVLYRPDVTVLVFPDQNPYKVKENTTNLQLTCNVTDSNPVATSYRWYKDNVKISTAVIYTIFTVNRSYTGSYTCDASNTVGISRLASDLQLDVLYGVSLQLSGTKIYVNESERWDLSCIGDGNPLPTITCVNGYNSTTVGTQDINITRISIEHGNCIDTGLYMCSGNNTIGEVVSISASVKVGCKPRTYNNEVDQDIFINGTDEGLNITIKFISFPLSIISWFKMLPDGNLTNIDSEFIISDLSSHLPYETISILQKDRLRTNEFGTYLAKAFNIYGSFLFRYHVIPKRAPEPPSNITASCDVTSIRVTWISGFNGGENQTFRIHFVNTLLNQTLFKENIADTEEEKSIRAVKESLRPDTLYIIFVKAYNFYGTTHSTEITNCTTKKKLEEYQLISSDLLAVILAIVSICVLAVIVIIVARSFYMRRGQLDSGRNKELIKRHSTETAEEEDGLKNNPLYVTSEDVSNAADGPVYGVVNKQTQNKDKIIPDDKKKQGPVYSEVQKSNTHDGLKDNPLYFTSGDVSNAEEGPVYGVVNKSKQKKETVDSDDKKNQGPVHAEVQKSSTHGKKKQKKIKTKDTSKKENNTNIELGIIYENSDKPFKHTDSEELYANAGEQDDVKILPVPYTPKKNKDGLIYAEVDLLPGPSGNRFVIRGQENRTNYAIIDLSKKAEPLPSDNEDEDNDSTYLN